MTTSSKNLLRTIGIVLAASGMPHVEARGGPGGCVQPEAPLPDPDPLGGPYRFCDGGDNHGDKCSLAEDCPSGLCRSAARVHNRYLEFAAPASWAGKQLALRVTMVNVDGFTQFNGDLRWIGAPQSYATERFATDVIGSDPVETFLAAALSCDPVYRDWFTPEPIFPYGSEIVASGSTSRSVYVIQAISVGCDTSDEALYSPRLFLYDGPMV